MTDMQTNILLAMGLGMAMSDPVLRKKMRDHLDLAAIAKGEEGKDLVAIARAMDTDDPAIVAEAIRAVLAGRDLDPAGLSLKPTEVLFTKLLDLYEGVQAKSWAEDLHRASRIMTGKTWLARLKKKASEWNL